MISFEIVIPNFKMSVPLTKGRRPIYYTEKDKIPKLYIGNIFKKGKLFDPLTKEYILKNAAFRDKPRFWKVSGNSVYSASIHHTVRSKAKEFYHNYFKEYIEATIKEPIVIPVGRYLKVSTVLKAPEEEILRSQDTGNCWLFEKWFLDTLIECGKIEDDSPKFIRESGGWKYLADNSLETKTLIIKIELI